MGVTASKSDQPPRPRTKSRRKFYGVLKHNFDLIEDKLSAERLGDEEYRVVQELIAYMRMELIAVAEDVRQRPKYEEMYNECLKRCDTFSAQLQAKRIPASTPASPSNKKRRRRKSERYVPHETASFEVLHLIRAEMQPLRDETLTFKGTKDDRIYHFLQESFERYVKRLRAIETFDRIQLKHEIKTAVAYARETQAALDQICEGQRPWLWYQQRASEDTLPEYMPTASVQRKRSKSMGDGLNRTSLRRFSSGNVSSGSAYAHNSDLSDTPMTPLSLKSYNFRVTEI